MIKYLIRTLKAPMIKINGGTPRSDEPSLCGRCRFGHAMKGRNRENYTFCRQIDKMITMDVIECSDHEDRNHPALYQLEKIAWPLCTDKKGERIGFRSPGQYDLLRKEGKVERFDPDEL